MKLSSQGTKFYVQDTVGVPGTAVTGITKAAPPVLSWTLIPPGLAAGDIVVPKGFAFKSIDNRVFPVSGIAANSAELFGADTSEEIGAGTMGTLSEVTFGESCMATITLSSPAGTTIDVSTLCDDARETIDGMPGISTWQATGFWDAEDAMQAKMRGYYKAGEKVVMQVIFNDGSGMVFMGTVNQFDVTVGVDQAVAFTMGGNVSGGIVDLPVGGVTTLAAAAPPPPAPEPARVGA